MAGEGKGECMGKLKKKKKPWKFKCMSNEEWKIDFKKWCKKHSYRDEIGKLIVKEQI